MSFISLEFIVFFAVVASVYYVIPHRVRWLFLLAGSYVFYGYFSLGYALLLLCATLLDYIVAIAISRTEQQRRRNIYLALSIALNLFILFLFKYFNFFSDSLATLFSALGLPYRLGVLNVLLPLGISFYTFQKMAYVIDVYRGRVEPEGHFGVFAVFVAFFPKLISGPLERAGHLIPQVRRQVSFEYAQVVEGFRLILWGVFKKVVVADRLAVYVDNVYGNVEARSGPVLILGTFFFAFQVYCDFAGYTDIALGVARVLGFDLTPNFRQPYFAQSVREFWQRWHISLSTWIRDYLFFPLTRKALQLGRRWPPSLVQFVVSVVVMGLVGLWHGANWTYVVWGALHGLYLAAETWFRGRTPRATSRRGNEPLAGLVKMGGTFLLVCLAWVFFRADTLSDAVYVLTHLFTTAEEFPMDLLASFGNSIAELILAMGLILLVVGADVVEARWGVQRVLSRSPAMIRWALYYATLAAILWLGIWGQPDFIYFQF